MLKFIRSKGNQQPSAERQKLQKELYAFRKVSQTATFNLDLSCSEKYEIKKTLYTFALRIVLVNTKISYQQQNSEKNIPLNNIEVCLQQFSLFLNEFLDIFLTTFKRPREKC